MSDVPEPSEVGKAASGMIRGLCWVFAGLLVLAVIGGIVRNRTTNDALSLPESLPVVEVLTPTATHAPTATATPTPGPTPTPIPAPSAGALRCLLVHECSGLFAWHGKAFKSPAWEQGVFWVDPSLPLNIQWVIREEIMPLLAGWRRADWREADEHGPDMLRWWSGRRNEDCRVLIDHRSPGCAKVDEVWLWPSHVQALGEVHYPQDYLYEVALHEAIHALFLADHTDAGIMCAPFDRCPEEGYVEHNGYRFALIMREIDEQVYALFGHPAIESRMTTQEVARLFSAPPPPTATPFATQPLSADEQAAIAAGTRCDGLASLGVLDWTAYPRIDSDGRISMSGVVGPDAPRLRDARSGAGGIIHPLFTFYALEQGAKVGRIWPGGIALPGQSTEDVFADVYNVTERSFDVAATLPPVILDSGTLYVIVWSERVEEPGNQPGSVAAVGTCKVWR